MERTVRKNLGSELIRKRGTVAAKIVFIVAFIVFSFYVLTLLGAFLWAILSSLKTSSEFGVDSLFGETFKLPREFLNSERPIATLFSNYKQVFIDIKRIEQISLFTMMFNSIWFAVGTAAIPLILTSMTAYVFAKYDFVGKKPLYLLVILMMMIPILGSLPSAYKLYHNLKLVESPLILLVYTAGFGGNFLILSASFEGVSWGYAESAQMDGANPYTVFFVIMWPQIIPAVFTLFILAFIGGWNDYYTPYLYLKSMPTLATGLYKFEFSAAQTNNIPVLFAGLIMMSIPIIIIFILLSDKIMSRVSIGGLKG